MEKKDFSKVKTLDDLYTVLGPGDPAFEEISRAIALRDQNRLRELLEIICGPEKGDELYNALHDVLRAQMKYTIPQVSNPHNINTTSASAFAVSIPPKEGTAFIHALGQQDLRTLKKIATTFLGEQAGLQFIEYLKPQLADYKKAIS